MYVGLAVGRVKRRTSKARLGIQPVLTSPNKMQRLGQLDLVQAGVRGRLKGRGAREAPPETSSATAAIVNA